MKPPRSILDPKFRYTSSARTDVAATFRRILREHEAKLSRRASTEAQNVQPIKMRKGAAA